MKMKNIFISYSYKYHRIDGLLLSDFGNLIHKMTEKPKTGEEIEILTNFIFKEQKQKINDEFNSDLINLTIINFQEL